MNSIKDYYSNCLHACYPEKYVIDQNEIEIPETAKTNLSFRLFDIYYNTGSDFNVKDNHLKSLKTMINDDISTRLKKKKKNFKNLDKIKILDNFFFNIENSNNNNNNKSNSSHINKEECILIENTFDSVIPKKGNIQNKPFDIKKKNSSKKKKEKNIEGIEKNYFIRKNIKYEKLKAGKEEKEKKEINLLNKEIKKINRINDSKENSSDKDIYELHKINRNIMKTSKINIPKINLSKIS
ncbi:conserved Plasmodium protein, unknown function [Plasmodium relictum]|uniref:Uncharacterized protein n=1 Tax=Plasmodium relictum TaxID=85471 RepID=A0A1J1H7K6_PLARL|nr:conserved Plasmodium protein, unknown function [Plasmodium relictum]CRH00764.1 conserved Plasmodium protein, unknown function [Plasmodium relictum]